MLSSVSIAAFSDELQKIAITRSVKEWQAANQAGNTGYADQIAQGSGQLGLKPRYLKDVSTGGQEAGVDLMMGHRQGPVDTGSGYMARKLYKPDSAISRGDLTSGLVAQKQQFTDTARQLPGGKDLVPAMYGHETHGTGGLQRTTSFHEYTPGQEISRSSPGASANLSAVQDKVLGPMKRLGLNMNDVITPGQGHNPGNIVTTPTGPKVIDFLPHVEGKSSVVQENMIRHPIDAQNGTAMNNMQNLRKEVFKPTMNLAERPMGEQQKLRSLFSPKTAPVSAAVPKAIPSVAHAAAPLAGMAGKVEQAAVKSPGFLGRLGGLFR